MFGKGDQKEMAQKGMVNAGVAESALLGVRPIRSICKTQLYFSTVAISKLKLKLRKQFHLY